MTSCSVVSSLQRHNSCSWAERTLKLLISLMNINLVLTVQEEKLIRQFVLFSAVTWLQSFCCSVINPAAPTKTNICSSVNVDRLSDLHLRSPAELMSAHSHFRSYWESACRDNLTWEQLHFKIKALRCLVHFLLLHRCLMTVSFHPSFIYGTGDSVFITALNVKSTGNNCKV